MSSFLIIVLLVPTVFLAIPAKQADAISGIGDITFDPSNFFQNTITAIATPVSAGANTTSAVQQTSFNLKVFLLDGIATALARGIVQQITAQAVNWINTGFNGNPAFITDPGQFFENIGDKTVVNALGSSAGSAGGTLLRQICSPFQPQIRLALVTQYLQDSNNQIGQCSIQQSIKNYDAFTQNFENGGWEGWFSVTQNMQNNPYGAYIEAQNSLTLSIQNQNQKYQDQLTQGKGFLSYEKCTNTTAAGNNNQDFADCINSGEDEAYCTETYPTTPDTNSCKTVTPGSVISDQLGKVLGSTVDELNLTNSINQVVSALMTQGIKSIFGGIQDGLRGLSESGQNNNASLVSQLMAGSSASNTQNSSTLAGIQSNVPTSLSGLTSGSADTSGFLPSIDEAAIQNEIKQQAAALQAQATASANATSTGVGTVSSNTGTCTYVTAKNAQTTSTTMSPPDCANVNGTWTPNTSTTNSTGGTTSTSASVCTNTTNTTPINITGIQGYSADTKTYTSTIYANSYMIVYGTGFNPACDTVAVGNTAYTPTYVSSTQLNVLLGTATGTVGVQVSSASAKSNALPVTIQ